MSRLIIILCMFTHIQCTAQAYQCVQPNQQHFFINNKGYLRAIRIDSVKTSGSTTILYPFRSPRGYYFNNQPLDINSGSWLGRTITVLPDGTHLFDNYWGDTVIIRSNATLNDSWRIYDDATDTFYTATVVAIDTMSVLNTIDSVKILELSAYNSQGILPTDPLHNERIIISKNHGVIRCCDMFMFPLHEPGMVYKQGFDYFLDKSTDNTGNDIFFNLVDFHNPDIIELNSFEVGDLFEYRNTNTPQWGDATETITIAEINSKQITPTEVSYIISGWNYVNYLGSPKPAETIPYTRQSKIQAKQYLFNLSKMPEETGQQDFFIYLPEDTTYCLNSPLYGYYSSFIYNNTVNTFEPCGYSHTYKEKLGKVIGGQCIDPPAIGNSYTLLFSKKAGKSCGNYFVLNVDERINNDDWNIEPNPAYNYINIHSPEAKGINYACFYNATGQIINTFPIKEHLQRIDVSNLTDGMYFLKLTDKNGLQYCKKIIIHH